MKTYTHKTVEDKWQKYWAKEKMYDTNTSIETEKKFYNLVMFPYPSGDKLHIGHWYNYSGTDIYGRFKRLQGYQVMQPIGFDSFGLPAENYAIKTGTPPEESTNNNIKHMRKQLKAIGAMWDWSHEIVTSAPEYYKWSQWIFLQLYKNKLAYRKKAPVNWCPSCQTVLANEQVQEGKCERCSTEVTKKELTQWFFGISKYAEKLLDHEGLDWPEKTILMQKNWIGKSVGSEVIFKVADSHKVVTVYTTRVDTIFSCAYIVIAPEHPLTLELTTPTQKVEVEAYIDQAKKQTDILRSSEDREKTGVFTGSYVKNPINDELIPVWTGDFVLAQYGTGAVFADAHDTRDFVFGKKYGIKMRTSIKPVEGDDTKIRNLEECFTEDGVLYNSAEFDGLTSSEARMAITKKLEKLELGSFKINYRLHDWLISRQRYWGAPIPIIYCEKCGELAVPEEQLPVMLPKDVDFNPKGQSPLGTSATFVNTKCHVCGGPATREVDTMDTFVCSSWYFLRYPSASNDAVAFNIEDTNRWLPVDMYIGGPEHACMHLLYARFINMVLNDLGYIKFKEPFKKLVHQGLITKEGAKMSKSKGNVVSPDEFVEKYGSDVFRMYLMFMGPYTEGGDWNDHGITGVMRFRERFWNLICSDGLVADETKSEYETRLNQLIKKVGSDLGNFQFNTAIASLMEFVNFATKSGISVEGKKALTLIIAPLAPHLAEECWQVALGLTGSVFNQKWPVFDAKKIVMDTVEIAIQVNGKLRGSFSIARGSEESTVVDQASEVENVKKFLEGKEILKTIYVPEKLVSFVISRASEASS